jgi:hypothetical protein
MDQPAPQNYSIVQQTADEIRDPENAPAMSVPPFLLSRNQMQLLNTLSIYGERGASRHVARVLYMNDVALAIWRDMGKNFDGARHMFPSAAICDSSDWSPAQR